MESEIGVYNENFNFPLSVCYFPNFIDLIKSIYYIHKHLLRVNRIPDNKNTININYI